MGDNEIITKDFPVSWGELHRNGKALAWKLLDKGPLEGGKWKGIIFTKQKRCKFIEHN